MITPDQIRAARALKNWSQTDLAARSGLTTPTIANIELGKQTPSATTLASITHSFEMAGIEFLDGEGVRKRSGQLYSFSGRDGFQDFYRDIDETALRLGKGEFLVSNVDHRCFLNWLSDEALHKHFDAILKTDVTYRVLTVEGNPYRAERPDFKAEYRWTSREQFYSVPYYVYGDKVAMIGFEDDDVNVFVMQNLFLSQLCRRQFNEMWDRSEILPDLPSDPSAQATGVKTTTSGKNKST